MEEVIRAITLMVFGVFLPLTIFIAKIYAMNSEISIVYSGLVFIVSYIYMEFSFRVFYDPNKDKGIIGALPWIISFIIFVIILQLSCDFNYYCVNLLLFAFLVFITGFPILTLLGGIFFSGLVLVPLSILIQIFCYFEWVTVLLIVASILGLIIVCVQCASFLNIVRVARWLISYD